MTRLTESQLRVLARGMEKRAAEQLVAAIKKVQAGAPLSKIEQAIISKNFDAVARALGIDDVRAALRAVQTVVLPVRDQAWFTVLAKIPAPLLTKTIIEVAAPEFARQSPRVMEAIRKQSLTRIAQATAETRAAIRQTLTAALAKGTHPTETARQLREVVGLNRQRARAVATFRAQLEARGVAAADVDRRVARFAEQQLNKRAVVIARTETMTALNAGQRLQHEHLVEEGVIREDEWEKEWVTADDGDRVCPICAPLNGVRVGLQDSFDTEVGLLDGPPAHPNCRCITRTVLKGFRAGEAPSPIRRAILGSRA